MIHVLKVLKTDFVTHNVKRFVVEKPPGYTFIPGQATDISINTSELKDELRPFTLTSLNEWDNLEFIIKIYKGHNGITEKLSEIQAGDELILHDVFGTINYHGPGLFIAGGAGITPFISIFRQLKSQNSLDGNTLLFANRTADDIILKDELKEMLGENYLDIIEETQKPGERKFIDRELLNQYVTQNPQFYYICGPDKFTEIMVQTLGDLGVRDDQIIIEK
jgi:ferredoxin-NADP reductase